MSDNRKTFEERLAMVEQIATHLESGQLGLEEAIHQFETGMKCLGELEKELGDARQRLTMIRTDAAGNVSEVQVSESERGVEEVEDLPF